MKLNVNRVILYLLIIVFLVLVLQYVLAFLNLRDSCNYKEGIKFKKIKKRARKGLKSGSKFALKRGRSYLNNPSAILKDAKTISNATLGKSITNSAINYVKESQKCKRKREELKKENKKLKKKLKNVQGMGAPVDENFANYY